MHECALERRNVMDNMGSRQQDALTGQMDIMDWMPEAAPDEPGDELVRGYISWHKSIYKKAYLDGPEEFTEFIRRECKGNHGGCNKMGCYSFGRMKAMFSYDPINAIDPKEDVYVFSAKEYEQRAAAILNKMGIRRS